VARIGNRRGVEHRHQAGEALWLAVVGGGGEQDQCFRAGRQPLGKTGALAPHRAAGPFGHVLAFIDHDDDPAGIIEIDAILAVVLERIDGDDRLVESVERVLVAWDLFSDPLNPHRIQPHQRDREARPVLLLELHQHAFARHHQ